MPPWHADPHYGQFSNDRSPAQADVDTLVAWANTGAAEGDARQAPKPLAFVDGWNIGKPDLILEMQEDYQVPASGTIKMNTSPSRPGSQRTSGSRWPRAR